MPVDYEPEALVIFVGDQLQVRNLHLHASWTYCRITYCFLTVDFEQQPIQRHNAPHCGEQEDGPDLHSHGAHAERESESAACGGTSGQVGCVAEGDVHVRGCACFSDQRHPMVN